MPWNQTLTSIRSQIYQKSFVQILVVALLSIILGGIAVTANIIYIVLAVGMLIGCFLIFKPKILIAAVLILGLLVTGVLPLWNPGFARLTWAVSLLGFLILLIAFATHFLQQKKDKKPTPVFLIIAIVFLFYSLFVTIAQWNSVGELFSAVKRYFQVWGIMFALAWLSVQHSDIKQLQKFMIFVAIVQLPFCLYQLIVFVPIREHFGYVKPVLIPIDVVSGTFGATLKGGGSNSEMATFQIIVVAFLLARWRENLFSTSLTVWLSIIVLIPLFLGETKIVVILLPIMFFGLYGTEILKKPVQGLMAIVVGMFLTVLAGYVYVEVIIGQSLQAVIDDTLRYNLYGVGYGSGVLNRTTVLTFWWEKNASDFVHLLIGHGLGSAHSGGKALFLGHIAKHYAGYGIGISAIAQMLWEVGVVGFVLFFMIIFLAWIHCSVLINKTIVPGYRADLSAMRAVMPMFLIYLFYRTSLIEIISFQIVFVLLLGYLAILSRLIGSNILNPKRSNG